MLKIVVSNQFKKDLKLAMERGLKIERLRAAVNTLANQETLDAEFRDRGLAGQYHGFRECRIERDWLLIYRTDEEKLELFLFRTGSRADCLIRRFQMKKLTPKTKIFAVAASALAACVAFVVVLTAVIIPCVRYNSAVSLAGSGKYEEAITAFQALNGYKDSAEQITKCDYALKDIDYNNAKSLIEACRYVEAYEALTNLNGFKDSSSQAMNCKYELLKKANVGDYVLFGSYEQDNDDSNGKEDVEWLVLAKEGNRILLISRYALCTSQYNWLNVDVTWESCSLRTWLNGYFIENSFSEEEQKMIATTTVTADKNRTYDTYPGADVNDKAFLLSFAEAEEYFTSDDERMCAPTEFALVHGVTTGYWNEVDGKATCWWWLRSPGGDSNYASRVFRDGCLYDYGGMVIEQGGGVRPAVWLDLEA